MATDTGFDNILVGALLAFVGAFLPAFYRRVVLHPAAFWCSSAVLFATLLFRDEVFRDGLRYTLQEFAIAVALAKLVSGKPEAFVRPLCWKPMLYVGRLSYSLYLWHWAVFCAIGAMGGTIRPARLDFWIYLALSFLLAASSFHLIEQPITRLRRRFGSHARTQIA